MKKRAEFVIIPNWIARTNTLTCHQKVLFVLLASYRPCFPGYLALSKATGLSRSSISRALFGLETMGLIKRNRRAGKSTVYEIVDKSYPQNVNGKVALGSPANYTRVTSELVLGSPANCNNTNPIRLTQEDDLDRSCQEEEWGDPNALAPVFALFGGNSG